MSQKIDVSPRMRQLLSLAVYLGFILANCNAELIITRPPRNATVLQDTGLLLHCDAQGPTKPRIRWYHDGEEMPRKGQNYRVGSTGTLRFKEVKVSDRGQYRCRAECGKEALYSNISILTVQVEVDIIRWNPTRKLIVEYNTDVSLSCVAAGIPGPKVQWRMNGQSITYPLPRGVQIDERWQVPDKLLMSVLTVRNLTSDAKFECEAVNQHITGDSVKSKIFDILVRSENDTTSVGEGICVRYNGTACSHAHGTGYVYLDTSRAFPFDYQESMAAELLNKMYAVETTQMIRERCNGHGENLICNYVFPPCDMSETTRDTQPKPIPICKESCIAVQDLLCYVQWPVIQSTSLHTKLPVCDSSLPSKWDVKQTCTQAKLFDRVETEVTSHCYHDRGRWYNGTVNVTRSGKPCQMWSSNQPQVHKRPPSVYKELEESENYCRNPGAEEESPWCYIDSELPHERWDLCEIPSCDTEEGSGRQTTPHTSMSWTAILIITIVGSIGIFATALIGVLCYVLVAKRHKNVRYKNTPQDDLEIDIQKLPANMSYHCVEEPVRLNPKLQAYEYPRNDIIYIKDIGQGAFGRVFKAKAPNLTKNADALVAVKMLKEDASDDLQADFEREASLMAEFGHPNIVKFLGVCAIGKPMCLLFEFMSKGDLNGYLRMCSPEMYMNFKKRSIQFVEGEMITADISEQLDMARQVAAGMMYLSEKNYVHRDLATRNCLIGDNLTVKISDFGLARSVHRLEYYKGSDNDAIPIRWMPLESILYNKFSVESDVWSYGVILWEIFSFALQPYYGMTHEEVVEYLKEGKNLVCPENTPPQIYNLMIKCWNRKPSSRPKFQMLFNSISALLNEMTKKRPREVSIV